MKVYLASTNFSERICRPLVRFRWQRSLRNSFGSEVSGFSLATTIITCTALAFIFVSRRAGSGRGEASGGAGRRGGVTTWLIRPPRPAPRPRAPYEPGFLGPARASRPLTHYARDRSAATPPASRAATGDVESHLANNRTVNVVHVNLYPLIFLSDRSSPLTASAEC